MKQKSNKPFARVRLFCSLQSLIAGLKWVPILMLLFMVVSIGSFFVAEGLHFGDVSIAQNPFSGAGTKFGGNLMKSLVNTYSADEGNSSEITFSESGSMQGLQLLLANQVEFAVCDSSPGTSVLTTSELQILPFAASAVVLFCNFNGSTVGSWIQLDRKTLVSIYLAQIRYWDDPAIVNTNPDMALPHAKIVPLHRTGHNPLSAADSVFLEALCQFDPVRWDHCVPNDDKWAVPNPTEFSTIDENSQMIAAVEATLYSIGYVPFANVEGDSQIEFILLENPTGAFVQPTLDSIQAALELADFERDPPVDSLVNKNCTKCWPMVSAVYILYYKKMLSTNCEHARAFSIFFQWLYGQEAQRIKPSFDFVPMNDEFVNYMLQTIKSGALPCQGNLPPLTSFSLSLVVGFSVLIVAISSLLIVVCIRGRCLGTPPATRDPERQTLLVNNGGVWQESSGSLVYGNPKLSLRSFPTNEPIEESIKIENDQLTFHEVIGRGTFATVYGGTWKGIQVAIKKINPSAIGKFASSGDFEREIHLMNGLRHPNVVLFLGANVSEHFIYIVTEYCKNGSLSDVIHNKNLPLPWDRQLQMSIDSAKGMLYLHERTPRIIHRDLKSSNLLVDKDWNVKVGDFGISTVLDGRMMTGNMGTVEYMAPECLKNEPYTEKCDVYSFGVVLCELFTREDLYQEMSVVQIRFLVRTQSLRPEVPNFIPIGLKNLIQLCWDTEPDVRPTFVTILSALVGFQEEPKTLLEPHKLIALNPTPRKSKNIRTPARSLSNADQNLWPHDSI